MMNKCKILLTYVLVAIYGVSSQNSGLNFCSKTIDILGLGRLEGSITKTAVTNQIVCQYLAIPYAEPTNGIYRFKPPRPVKPWKGTRDVSKNGTPCPTITLYNDKTPSEWFNNMENCLHLSVYTKTMTRRNPVMFFIHGGGFYNGSSSNHPPQYLLEGDIVLVVAQYRLGPFGFLSTNSSLIPGNAAVHDVILALKWVQQFIRYFGGDSKKVTIFGQSAGASLASLLIISPVVPYDLFHYAILQSGAITADWSYRSDSLEQASEFARKANCVKYSNMNEVTHCLLTLSATDLLTTASKGNFNFCPTLYDYGGIMPTTPYDMLSYQGKSIPVMAGITKHDGSFVVANLYDQLKYNAGSRIPNTIAMIRKFLRVFRTKEKTGLVDNFALAAFFTQEQFYNETFQSLLPNIIDLASTLTMKSPVLEFVQRNSEVNPSQTFLYTFDYKGQHTSFGYGEDTSHYPFLGGVHHSDDNLYLFPTVALNPKDMEISKLMVELWTSFAKYGRPMSNKVPFWLPVTRVTGPYLKINENSSIGNDFMDEFKVTIKEKGKQILFN